MVNTGEELLKITLQHISILASELIAAQDGAVSALACPVGIRVCDKAALPDRLDHPAQSMVHHPVAERCGRDKAALGIVNVETMVCTGRPGAGKQLLLKLQQLFFLRPVPGWASYRTPIRNLYLCGSGTHPGGGVSGAPGRLAALTILGRHQE